MSLFSRTYDVIVVGGGHAGSEAAAAAANMGAHTLLITMNLQNIAQMSCNPAMGGIAKGQIIREIDALGGYSGIVTDKTAIQFKMLNKSKGPAMWSPRAQSDRMQFAECWRTMLEQTENVDFYQDSVNGLVFDGYKIIGVKTALGLEINAKTVIITAGTFLNGLIHIGDKSFGGGRAGEGASRGITEDLVAKGFEAGRMKTGTPPRVDGRSLDYSKMTEQPGDEITEKFSYLPTTSALKKQRSCWLTYTNPEVHNLLRGGFDRSPMFNGRIQSSGPRYCPSVEDKVDRFATKERHQIFVEPEGWSTIEMYVNGFSTSLPEDIQDKAIRAVAGFENVKFLRYGYAIEYDFFQPTQLTHSLETKLIENLFFAGQINGTTGYEEAAAQGLMAGVNAALKVQGKEPFTLKLSPTEATQLNALQEEFQIYVNEASLGQLETLLERARDRGASANVIAAIEGRVKAVELETQVNQQRANIIRQERELAAMQLRVMQSRRALPFQRAQDSIIQNRNNQQLELIQAQLDNLKNIFKQFSMPKTEDIIDDKKVMTVGGFQVEEI